MQLTINSERITGAMKALAPHLVALSLIIAAWMTIYHFGPNYGWTYGTQLMGMIAITPLYFVVLRICKFSPESVKSKRGSRMSRYNSEKLSESVIALITMLFTFVYIIAFIALEIWLVYQGCTGGMELWIALVIAAALLVLSKIIFGLALAGTLIVLTAIFGVFYIIGSAFSSGSKR